MQAAPAITDSRRSDRGGSRVAVLASGGGTCLEHAASLARELNLPLVDSDSPDYDLLLAWTGTRLELRDNRDPRVGAVYVDFARAARQRTLVARDPLVRAIGRQTRFVVDATLGLAGDAYLLARYGYEVLGIERNPALVALIDDALVRAGQAVGLRLMTGDARSILPSLDPAPDVVYMDPMFPPKRRASSAVRKELRLLRLLVGEDIDAQELFNVARRVARQRVVVKRPDHAPPLEANPTVSYGGKLVRYDVYRASPAPA
jgi:16S rRNA (guanine1516-N2)-methyltransferase